MIQVSGTYEKGTITLDEDVTFSEPVKVFVSFAEENVDGQIKYPKGSDFSFAKGREILKEVKNSFSDDVINERRSAL